MGKSRKPLGKAQLKSRYIKKESEWFESPAYRDLTSNAKCLLDEFLNIYRPGRNGDLTLSIRDATERLHISVNTCGKAYHELVEHGFLVLTDHEDWMNGMARAFELTVRDNDNRQAKHLWRFWKPGSPVNTLPEKLKRRSQNLGGTVSKIKTVAS